MEDVAGARRIDNRLARHRQCRQARDPAALVIPEKAALAFGDAANPAALRFQEIEHLRGRQFHLLAEPLGDDRDIDMFEQLLRVGAYPAAVERSQDAARAAFPGVVERRVGLMAVEMQDAAALEIEARKVA